MTKRRVKRRKEISAECKVLSVKDLTEFIGRLKHKLKNLARKNREQKARQQQRKWHNALHTNPGSVYKHLTNCVQKKKNEEKPRVSRGEKEFKLQIEQEEGQKHFLNTGEVESF